MYYAGGPPIWYESSLFYVGKYSIKNEPYIGIYQHLDLILCFFVFLLSGWELLSPIKFCVDKSVLTDSLSSLLGLLADVDRAQIHNTDGG